MGSADTKPQFLSHCLIAAIFNTTLPAVAANTINIINRFQLVADAESLVTAASVELEVPRQSRERVAIFRPH